MSDDSDDNFESHEGQIMELCLSEWGTFWISLKKVFVQRGIAHVQWLCLYFASFVQVTAHVYVSLKFFGTSV
jgi:hypothetical protein